MTSRETTEKMVGIESQKLNILNRKLAILQVRWVGFDRVNNKWIPHEQRFGDQPYFKEDYFEKTTKKYKKVIQKEMLNSKDQISKHTPSNSTINAPSVSTINDITNNESNDDSDDESGDGNGIMSDETPPEVRVLMYQHKELKCTMKMKLKNDDSAGLAIAQLEILRLIWAEFRAYFRAVSVTNMRVINGINFTARKIHRIMNNLGSNTNKKMNVQLPEIRSSIKKRAQEEMVLKL